MASNHDAAQKPPRHETLFLTTRWSVVLAAREVENDQALHAMEVLCRTYWQPLYIYARRRGHTAQDAEDATQGFFARLLEKGFLQSVQQERGRFRQFMLMAFQRHLANEWDRSRRLKRGGGQHAVPLDTVLGEKLYREETPPHASADDAYDRRWALTLLEQTLGRLRAEYERAGREQDFVVMKPQLVASRGEASYASLASQLDCTEGAARVAVHRLRKRFREIFREEIAQTVANEADLEDEIRHLIAVLAQGTPSAS
ncbi:RNA polymerase sigma-70 factor (ECF subfamily) [Roseimicrobium gellanilyticum]|uniref:RNA polymerase sigma-70 factor (ECF subfamily) n=1 Tax=Roseimicrobium gellanilyticum TaxID=748857 RepID=A0A366HP67_9BACT|nr:sigma-70 family RNA polymerase sigma factor [Roseimicrobium gellanilyticum]RBP45287.1 RNA polymerase sigma-70 factor (ECF subfamily) [Roseimicrobium gellanilyticum]